MAMEYHLTDRTFSREWRRGKRYSKQELRWLARKKGLEFVERGGAVKLVNKLGKAVANFAQKAEESEAVPRHPMAHTFAALVVGKTILLLLACAACGQTYEERVVAAVLMGEAWNQGAHGMTAVGEVISQRVKQLGKTPAQVVMARKQFSCLDDSTPAKLVVKFAREPDFKVALRIAQQVCRKPESLPGITARATNYTRREERPVWAKGKKPVVVIGDHAFYRLALK